MAINGGNMAEKKISVINIGSVYNVKIRKYQTSIISEARINMGGNGYGVNNGASSAAEYKLSAAKSGVLRRMAANKRKQRQAINGGINGHQLA